MYRYTPRTRETALAKAQESAERLGKRVRVYHWSGENRLDPWQVVDVETDVRAQCRHGPFTERRLIAEYPAGGVADASR